MHLDLDDAPGSTRDPERFVDFYESMYLPYIGAVYGDGALFHSLESLRRIVSDSELLLIKRDHEVIAGQVLIYQHKQARTREIGVKDGQREYVKAGAVGALYYYGLQHLKNRGYARVDVGASRAWLNDGVLQFKKKWGMELTGVGANGLVIQPREFTDGIAAFLGRNPFITLRDGVLDGAFFLRGKTLLGAADVRRLHRDYYLRGMGSLAVFPLAEGPCSIENPGDVSEISLRQPILMGS